MKTYPSILSHTVPSPVRSAYTVYTNEIIGSIPENDFESITYMASEMCQVPMALISLLDEDRQCFRTQFGTSCSQVQADFSICHYTILHPEKMLVIDDLRKDKRFKDSPMVTGEPYAVFYSGVPIISSVGEVLGSICILDKKVRTLSEGQIKALKALARQVTNNIELRVKVREHDKVQQRLLQVNRDLEHFARNASHDLKTPLANLSMLIGAFGNLAKDTRDDHKQILYLMDKSVKHLSEYIDRVLLQACTINLRPPTIEAVNTDLLVRDIIELIAPPADIDIRIKGVLPSLSADRSSLQQVFQNILTNAIKYNDKKKPLITISSCVEDQQVSIDIADNGSGISKKDFNKIFRENVTLHSSDRYGLKGTGMGLARIRELLATIGGKIELKSKKGIGSIFTVIFPVSFLASNEKTYGMMGPSALA